MTVVDGSDKTTADHRLSLDHRGRPHLLHRSQLHDESAAGGLPDGRQRHRSDLRHQLPHQLHAGRGDGLHRGRCPANRARRLIWAHAGGVRRRQRRLPDRLQRKQTPSIPARSIWIRPSATTSRFCRAMRPTRSDRNAGQLPAARRGPPTAATAWAALRSPPAQTAGHGADATHSVPTGETLGVRVRGRLPAQRRAGRRRRRRRAVAQRARPGRLQHHPL